jgi:quercetin dioxygenase-like cupin family protein
MLPLSWCNFALTTQENAMPNTFETFKSVALAEGFDEVLERVWAPNTVLEEHTHPFSVKAKVVQGEMWLTVGGETQHLVPGELFELEYGVPHAERYGPEGATYWVARLN